MAIEIKEEKQILYHVKSEYTFKTKEKAEEFKIKIQKLFQETINNK